MFKTKTKIIYFRQTFITKFLILIRKNSVSGSNLIFKTGALKQSQFISKASECPSQKSSYRVVLKIKICPGRLFCRNPKSAISIPRLMLGSIEPEGLKEVRRRM